MPQTRPQQAQGVLQHEPLGEVPAQLADIDTLQNRVEPDTQTSRKENLSG